VQSAQDLADTLSGCELLLSADRIGPTSRRGTLAASLAAGRPVVALDGRHSWRELRESGGALLVDPVADALAGAIAGLIEDEGARSVLMRRSRDFARQSMSVERSARVVGGLLHEVAEGFPRAAASASGA
jgi:glycosyltransferase involved in cell wall biosynthesis